MANMQDPICPAEASCDMHTPSPLCGRERRSDPLGDDVGRVEVGEPLDRHAVGAGDEEEQAPLALVIHRMHCLPEPAHNLGLWGRGGQQCFKRGSSAHSAAGGRGLGRLGGRELGVVKCQASHGGLKPLVALPSCTQAARLKNTLLAAAPGVTDTGERRAPPGSSPLSRACSRPCAAWQPQAPQDPAAARRMRAAPAPAACAVGGSQEFGKSRYVVAAASAGVAAAGVWQHTRKPQPSFLAFHALSSLFLPPDT